MHPLKLVEATKTLIQMEGVTLSSPACQKSLLSFYKNLRLTLGLVASPGWSAMIKMQWDVATRNAAVDVGGVDGLLSAETWTPDQVKNWEKGRNELMAQIVSENSPLLHHHLEVMTRELDTLASRCGEFVHGMMEGLLKSLCIQAWTAIEVLIEDLHSQTIEDHPQCFSDEIREMQFKTRNYVKPGKRFFFRRREQFRDSYSYAFSYDRDIDSAIGHNALDALVSIRNLIVHKGGIVDAQFLKEEEPKAPTLKTLFSLVDKQELKFDGNVTHTLIDDAVGQAYKLIRAVNAWLEAKHFASLR